MQTEIFHPSQESPMMKQENDESFGEVQVEHCDTLSCESLPSDDDIKQTFVDWLKATKHLQTVLSSKGSKESLHSITKESHTRNTIRKNVESMLTELLKN